MIIFLLLYYSAILAVDPVIRRTETKRFSKLLQVNVLSALFFFSLQQLSFAVAQDDVHRVHLLAYCYGIAIYFYEKNIQIDGN